MTYRTKDWDEAKKESLRQQNNRCAYCGISLEGRVSHLDHIIPKSRGGETDKSNLLAVCSFCNYAKLGLDLSELLLWLSHIRSGAFNITAKTHPEVISALKDLLPEERDLLK